MRDLPTDVWFIILEFDEWHHVLDSTRFITREINDFVKKYDKSMWKKYFDRILDKLPKICWGDEQMENDEIEKIRKKMREDERLNQFEEKFGKHRSELMSYELNEIRFNDKNDKFDCQI